MCVDRGEGPTFYRAGADQRGRNHRGTLGKGSRHWGMRRNGQEAFGEGDEGGLWGILGQVNKETSHKPMETRSKVGGTGPRMRGVVLQSGVRSGNGENQPNRSKRLTRV